MTKTYNRLKSKTIWGGIVSAVSPIVLILSTNTACVNALSEVVDPKLFAGITSAIGVVLTIYGREDAETKHRMDKEDAVRTAIATTQDDLEEGNVY